MASLIENKLRMPLPPAVNNVGDLQGTFFAYLVEFALGKVTAQQLTDLFELDPTEQAEAQALFLNVKNGHAALAGNTALQRAFEACGVLFLTFYWVAPYNDPAAVRARLGLP